MSTDREAFEKKYSILDSLIFDVGQNKYIHIHHRVSQAADQYNQMLDVWQAAKEDSQWISIEDQMPSISTWNLVSVGNQHGKLITCRGFLDGDLWIVAGEDVELDEVTHWMPLPEPPKS